MPEEEGEVTTRWTDAMKANISRLSALVPIAFGSEDYKTIERFIRDHCPGFKDGDYITSILMDRVLELEKEVAQETMARRVYQREAIMHHTDLHLVMKLHEALLNTLAPSKNNWVHLVHRNASGAYSFRKQKIDEMASMPKGI